MIDIAKLEGIQQAIDEESRLPSPSHANLARLISMFFKLLIEDLAKEEPIAAEVVPEVPATPEIETPKKTKARHSKKQ